MTNEPVAKEFVDLFEAAGEFGGSLHWWRKIVHIRGIDSFRRGDRVVLKRADIIAYLEARRVPAKKGNDRCFCGCTPENSAVIPSL